MKLQAGQQLVIIWKHKGKECPFVPIVDPTLVKTFSDYALIERDLISARECIEQILSLKTDNSIVNSSLFSNAITSYGRGFTSGEGKGVILDPNQVFKNAPAELSTHDFMMNLRHRF